MSVRSAQTRSLSYVALTFFRIGCYALKASNGVKFNQSASVGRNQQLLPARDLHFTKDQSQMSANSRFLNEQPIRNLLVLKTLRERIDDLKFSGG